MKRFKKILKNGGLFLLILIALPLVFIKLKLSKLIGHFSVSDNRDNDQRRASSGIFADEALADAPGTGGTGGTGGPGTDCGTCESDSGTGAGSSGNS